MEYLLLLGTRAEAWRRLSAADRAKWHRRIGAWFADLRRSTAVREQRKLDRAHSALTVRVRDGETSIAPGPFGGTDEVIVAYVVVDVADVEAALHWASSWPMPDATVEVRPVQ